MAANPQELYMSEEDYLAFDRASEYKHEYHEGRVVAMSGGTIGHVALGFNMAYLIRQGLGKSGPCRVYTSDARVKVGKKRYVYPDVTVSCDVSDYRRENDVLLSPHLVVEVLSPSTESVDRVKKLQWYTQHPCIEEYVLVNTRVQRVELYRRELAGEEYIWHDYSWSAGEEIELDSLDLRIPVDELYADLRIPLPGEDGQGA